MIRHLKDELSAERARKRQEKQILAAPRVYLARLVRANYAERNAADLYARICNHQVGKHGRHEFDIARGEHGCVNSECAHRGARKG